MLLYSSILFYIIHLEDYVRLSVVSDICCMKFYKMSWGSNPFKLFSTLCPVLLVIDQTHQFVKDADSKLHGCESVKWEFYDIRCMELYDLRKSGKHSEFHFCTAKEIPCNWVLRLVFLLPAWGCSDQRKYYIC